MRPEAQSVPGLQNKSSVDMGHSLKKIYCELEARDHLNGTNK